MEFAPSKEALDYQQRLEEFMASHVYPAEAVYAEQRRRAVIIRQEIALGSGRQGPAPGLRRRRPGDEHEHDQWRERFHGVTRRSAISSRLVPDRSVSVVSREAKPGRSNRSECVPGGSSSLATGSSYIA